MKKRKKQKAKIGFAILAVVMFLVTTSKDVFASSANIKILAPVSGEVWRVGETHVISWKSSGLGDAGIKKLGIFIQNDHVGGSGNSMYITPNGDKISASQKSYSWKIESNQIALNNDSNDMKKFEILIYGYDSDGNQKIVVDSPGKFTISTKSSASNDSGGGNFTLDKCVKVQQMIGERRTYFWNKGNEFNIAYSNLLNSVNTVITNLDGKGADIVVLKNQYVQLQSKVDGFTKDFNAYSDGLVKTAQVTDNGCTRPMAEFKGKLLKTQTLLQTVRDDVVGIQVYVNQTIIPQIKMLKTQVQ